MELSLLVASRENTAKLEGPTLGRLNTLAEEINAIRQKLKERVRVRERSAPLVSSPLLSYLLLSYPLISSRVAYLQRASKSFFDTEATISETLRDVVEPILTGLELRLEETKRCLKQCESAVISDVAIQEVIDQITRECTNFIIHNALYNALIPICSAGREGAVGDSTQPVPL